MKERRNLPRWQINSSCRYEALGKTASMAEGLLADINLVGAKVYLRTKEPLRAKVSLKIDLPNQDVPICAEGEVAWQNLPRAGGFLTGIRFTVFKPCDKEKVLVYCHDKIRHSWWQENRLREK